MAVGAGMGNRGAPAIPPTTFEARFGISARLNVFLQKSTGTTEAKEGITGWLFNHTEEVTEEISTKSFLYSAKELLPQVGMNHVSVINIGDYEVYLSPGGSTESNCDDAFFKALGSDRAEVPTNTVWMLLHGLSKDFEFEQDVTFWPKHRLAHPAIALGVLAVPAEWTKQDNEAEVVFKYRLSRTLEDKEGVRLAESQGRQKVERYLQDYRALLAKYFRIEDVTESLKINLSAVDAKAFDVQAG